MTFPMVGASLRWGVPLAVLAAGAALRDCLVVAAAGPLALCAFYLGMDANAPADAFRVSVRSALAGVASLVAAGLLALVTLAAIQGAWLPAHGGNLAGAWVLAASITAFTVLADEMAPSMRSVGFWLFACLAFVSAFSLVVLKLGNAWSLCAVPLATAVLMALAGWRLLSEVVPGLLELGVRR